MSDENKIIPYAKHEITEDDKRAVLAALESEYLTQGPAVAEFERAAAAQVRARHGVALANGTAALHIACLALEKLFNAKRSPRKKKKVITSAITFAASANCALYAGLEPELVDISPDTLCLDTAECVARINTNPQDYVGIVPVSFGGRAANLEELSAICRKHDIWMLEDACHAFGAWSLNSKNEKIYSASCHYSDAAILSFHPAKHVAAGEGGLVLTNDPALADACSLLRTHGIQKNIPGKPRYYMEMTDLGFNYRIPDLLCALGSSQLKRLAVNLELRNKIAEKYFAAFAHFPGVKCSQSPSSAAGHNAFHLFVIECQQRDELYDFLRQRQIYCQVHYTPLYRHPYYQKLNVGGAKDFPKAEKYFSACLSLPMYPTLSDREQSYVIEKIKEFYESRV